MQANIFYSADLLRDLSRLEIEQDENRELFSPRACAQGGRLAIAHGPCLTLLAASSPDDAIVAELDFDHPLEALCWAPSAADAAGGGGGGAADEAAETETAGTGTGTGTAMLLVAGDSNGTLHFITASGILVFSRRVIQG
jgi:hypothetical protein